MGEVAAGRVVKHLLFVVFALVPFSSTKAVVISDKFARPTVLNPATRRRIDVGGPTYRRLMNEGAWVHCDDTLRRLDLEALKIDQRGSSAPKCDLPIPHNESQHLQWHLISPGVVDGSAGLPPDVNSNLLFVNKPSGMHCVPPRDLSDSLSSQLSALFPGAKPCHRLDRDTSGIVVFGLDANSHRDISKQFEARTVLKQYAALVSGHPRQDEGNICLPIGKTKTEQGFNQWSLGGENVREAITVWRVEERFMVDGAKFSRLLLEPKTGRGHQLRLHLKAIGHPILGDTIHGQAGNACCSPRLCLHALKLQLDWDGRRLEVVSVSPF